MEGEATVVKILKRIGALGLGRYIPVHRRPSPSQPRHPLLQDLDALDPRQRREFACALAMLWEEFTSETEDPGHPSSVSQKVLAWRLAAYQVRQNGGSEKLHYALAPELIALYAETLLKADLTPRDHEIATAVEEVVAQGNLLRRAGSGLRSMARGSTNAA